VLAGWRGPVALHALLSIMHLGAVAPVTLGSHVD
jgi:hypothetical protein